MKFCTYKYHIICSDLAPESCSDFVGFAVFERDFDSFPHSVDNVRVLCLVWNNPNIFIFDADSSYDFETCLEFDPRLDVVVLNLARVHVQVGEVKPVGTHLHQRPRISMSWYHFKSSN